MDKDAYYILQIVQSNSLSKTETLKYTYNFDDLLKLSGFSEIRLRQTLKELKSFGYIRSTSPTDGNPYTLISFNSF